MNSLVSSFQRHLGLRGVHLYNDKECKFLNWQEVVSFVSSLPPSTDPEFGDKLLGFLSNYDPDQEFIAVRPLETQISIELYSLP